MRSWKIISVDFDGTLCDSLWPEIGEPKIKFIEYIKKRQREGDRIILNTCRIGKQLKEAVKWCNERGLYFDAVNENLEYQIERYGKDCRKISADIYYDDKNANFKYRE